MGVSPRLFRWFEEVRMGRKHVILYSYSMDEVIDTFSPMFDRHDRVSAELFGRARMLIGGVGAMPLSDFTYHSVWAFRDVAREGGFGVFEKEGAKAFIVNFHPKYDPRVSLAMTPFTRAMMMVLIHLETLKYGFSPIGEAILDLYRAGYGRAAVEGLARMYEHVKNVWAPEIRGDLERAFGEMVEDLERVTMNPWSSNPETRGTILSVYPAWHMLVVLSRGGTVFLGDLPRAPGIDLQSAVIDAASFLAQHRDIVDKVYPYAPMAEGHAEALKQIHGGA